MTLLIFPAAVGLLTIGTWLAIAFVDACLLGHTDAKFNCWSGLEIVTLFACICAGLTALAAGLVRILLHRFVAFESIKREVAAALLSSVALVAAFYAMVLWEIDIGGIAGMFFGWLISSFVICGVMLLIVGWLYGTRTVRAHEPPL